MRGLRRLAGAALLALAATAAQAQTLRATPDEALLTAQAAYAAGAYDVAYRIAQVLVTIDPDNPRILLLLAATEARLGRPEAAVAAGRTAWGRASDAAPVLRYEIARNTARAAFDAGRPFAAQFWLRRSLDVAPDDAARGQSGQDLAFVRDQNPWRLSFGLEAGPSDNLNGGAADPVFRIGDFVIGRLDNGAVALSGARAAVRVQAERLVSASGTGQTVLGLSAEVVRNRIDAASRGAAGAVRSRDLDRTELGLSLRRDLLAGKSGWPVSLSAGVAQSWAGGAPYAESLNIGAQTALARGQAGSLWLSGQVTRAWEGTGNLRVDGATATLLADRALPWGTGRWDAGLTVETSRSDDANSTYDAVRLSLGLRPDWRVGPAEVAFSATASLRDYPVFVLFGDVNVTAGRQDRSAGLSADLTFDDWSVMGFAPVLRLQTGRTASNVSRYATTTTAISFGIDSAF